MISSLRRTGRLKACAAAVLVAGLALGGVAHAAITFQFQFSADPTDAFNDATYGAARQAALVDAGARFSTLFGSYFANSATITMSVAGSNNAASNTLASAGSYLNLSGSAPAGFNINDVVRVKLLTGVDTNGASADGKVDVNFGHAWQLGYGNPVSGSEFDFYSTLYHEFTHTLGFSSTIRQSGADIFGTTQNWGAFDQFITNAAGTPVINPSTFQIDQTVWNAASVGGLGTGLFFDGAHAVAANGGHLVPLYSPTSWQAGSSASHLDNLAPFSTMLMDYAATTGLSARDYSAVELGMLADLGYVSAVPEPGISTMLLAGIAVMAWMRRRNRG